MTRVRLATTIPVHVAPSFVGENASPEMVPFITEEPRDYDFELACGDCLAVGPYGLWTLHVTRRRVGMDGVLIAVGELDTPRSTGRHSSPGEELIARGWMPDVSVALNAAFSEFLTEDTSTDPVAVARAVASQVIRIPRDYVDWPAGLDACIRRWAELRAIEPAAAA